VPNFLAIGQTFAKICRLFHFSNMAAFRHLGFVMRVFGTPTNGIVFITVQNLVGIDAVVSITCMFLISRFWLENAYSGPPKLRFLGDSNETHAQIADPPNSAQLEGSPYHSLKLHPGPCSSVDVRRPRTDTHTQTHTHRQTHRRGWPQYISRRLYD